MFVRALGASLVLATVSTVVYADHAWSNYHWRKTSAQVNLNVGDNVSTAWDAYLNTAISDWNPSSVIQLTKVTGGARPKQCRPTAGRIEVCNARYGNNGWLGIAQIWLSGGHISQGVAKMNDTYFETSTYNTPAWRRLVMCQEIAHDFGLDHQDEDFDNANLGSCMDYTSDPDGPPSNEHPNAHDFDQLEAIYAHTDSAAVALKAMPDAMNEIEFTGRGQWGRPIHWNGDGKPDMFMLNFGGGHRVVTHVFWAPFE